MKILSLLTVGIMCYSLGYSQHYIKNQKVLVERVYSESDLNLPGLGSSLDGVNYTDGYGRTIQNVTVRGSNSAQDLIQYSTWDAFNIQRRKYLSYARTQAPGIFDLNALGNQANFYSATGGDEIVATSYPYADTEYEASPLRRTLSSGSPGQAWQLGSGHEIVYSVGTNGSTDKVVILQAEIQSGILEVKATGYYPQGTLSRQKIVNEDGLVIITFTDRYGKPVLSRRVIESGYQDTYHVYNSQRQLVARLSPMLVDNHNFQSAAFPITIDQDELDGLGYQYLYDDRERIIEQKWPGVEPVHIVYDRWDRVVAQQDGNLRAANQWKINKYDRYNRLIITGLIINNDIRKTLQARVDQFYVDHPTYRFEKRDTAQPFGYTTSFTFPTHVDEVLSASYFDDYGFMNPSDGHLLFQPRLENLKKSEQLIGLRTGGLVKVFGEGQFLKEVIYYDSLHNPIQTISEQYPQGRNITSAQYSFTGQKKVIERISTNPQGHVQYQQSFEYDHVDREQDVYIQLQKLHWENQLNIEEPQVGRIHKSLDQWSWGSAGASSEESFNGDGWVEYSFTSHHEKQVVGISSSNLDSFGFGDIEFGIYGFEHNGSLHTLVVEGGVLRTSGVATDTTDIFRIARVGNEVKYYRNGTLFYTSQLPSSGEMHAHFSFYTSEAEINVAGNFTETILQKRNEYNAIGQLADKNLHSEDAGNSFLQSLDYRYNERGWLLSINDVIGNPAANNDNNALNEDLFGLLLHYQNPISSGAPQYFDSRISAWQWKTGSNPRSRFMYQYDMRSQLTSAAYAQWGTSTFSDAINTRSVDNLSYDLNGNIQSLKRNEPSASNPGVPTPMDDLTYNYTVHTNRLRSVSDNGNDNGFVDRSYLGDEYRYDANGNLTEDRNKGVDNISYNLLNLPEVIDFGDGNTIEYDYSADGMRLGERIYEGGELTFHRLYNGEFYFENDTLVHIKHSEGQISFNYFTKREQHNYDIQDHLGSPRLTFSGDNETYSLIATFEPAFGDEEDQFFTRISETQTNDQLFNTTGPNAQVPNPSYSACLNGLDPNRTVGPGITLAVGPGDVVEVSVNAMFVGEPSESGQSNAGNIAAAIASSFGYASVGEGAAIYQNLFNTGMALLASNGSNSDDNVPAAYLNYMYFDWEMNEVSTGFQMVSEDANNYPEEIEMTIEATKPGYVFIFLSNQQNEDIEVCFDDLTVTVQESMVKETVDYYPFGMPFNQYTRFLSEPNRHLYTDKMLTAEHGLNWLDVGARYYDFTLARWSSVDPLADKMAEWSGYASNFNNPVSFMDPDGRQPKQAKKTIRPINYTFSVRKEHKERFMAEWRRFLATPTGKKWLSQLQDNQHVHVFFTTHQNSEDPDKGYTVLMPYEQLQESKAKGVVRSEVDQAYIISINVDEGRAIGHEVAAHILGSAYVQNNGPVYDEQLAHVGAANMGVILTLGAEDAKMEHDAYGETHADEPARSGSDAEKHNMEYDVAYGFEMLMNRNTKIHNYNLIKMQQRQEIKRNRQRKKQQRN